MRMPQPTCASCGERTTYHDEVADDGPLEGLVVAICDECGGEWE